MRIPTIPRHWGVFDGLRLDRLLSDGIKLNIASLFVVLSFTQESINQSPHNFGGNLKSLPEIRAIFQSHKTSSVNRHQN